ncbi:MAG: restriction endonuclease subunit S [Chitinophagales bacterium]|nr:restriction endonuclease subunit S [Chitinophagales bacterium]
MATIKKEMRLGDALVSLKTGLNPRDNFQLNTADANNWYITVRELSGVAIDFLPQTDKVNDFALCLINNRSNLEVGDVLFSGTGSIGKTAIIREKPLNWNIKEGVYTLKPKKNILDSYFLLLLLQYYSKTNIFLKLSAGSTVFSVPMQSLANFKINLPDLPTQKSIAKVLSDLDAKIELNNKINRELEAMAKTLYDYWFVQFDFPDANGRPYKSSGGKMVYNAELKREIPEGWEVKKLIEIEYNIITGKTPSTKVLEYFGGDIPFITIDDIRGQLFILHAERTLSILGADSQSTKYLHPGDICVSCIGTIGVIGIVSKLSQTNQQINSIAVKNSYNRYFLLNALKNYFDFNVAAKKGAVLSNMNKAEFSDIPILDSRIDVKEEFNKIVEPLYNKIEINLKQNQHLTALRDWLLPMLMNGQVTVKEAEEKLSMAAEPSVKYGN